MGELVLGDVIGAGFFGEVKKASWKGIDVAVKYIYRRNDVAKEMIMFYKEISILRLVILAQQIATMIN